MLQNFNADIDYFIVRNKNTSIRRSKEIFINNGRDRVLTQLKQSKGGTLDPPRLH